MGALTMYGARLCGSDWGEPTDREETGFDVEILEFECYVHLGMRPANAPESKRYMALFSLSEAREFVVRLQAAIDRVKEVDVPDWPTVPLS